jgi:hypothetical protein
MKVLTDSITKTWNASVNGVSMVFDYMVIPFEVVLDWLTRNIGIHTMQITVLTVIVMVIIFHTLQ